MGMIAHAIPALGRHREELVIQNICMCLHGFQMTDLIEILRILKF